MIWLDNSRIIAIYAVVFLHVSSGVVLGSDVSSGYWWFGNIYDSAVRWCVPVFVMISGALLLDPEKKEDLLTFYKKRLSRILLPIFFWSAFFLCWAVYKGAFLGGFKPSIVELLIRFLTGKPHYHMWFLFMLLILYLFTPFFRKVVTYSTKRELLFLICAIFIIAAVNSAYESFVAGGPKFFINWFLPYIPYFFLGHLIRQTDASPSKVLLFIVFTLSFIATALGCYLATTRMDAMTGLYFYDYQSITVIPMSISVMYLLKSWNSPVINKTFTRRLSALTLGTYLIHPVILELINYKGLGTTWFNPLVSIPVIATIVFFTSLAGTWVIYQIPYLKRTI